MPGRPIAFVCAMPMELIPLTRDLGLVETEVDGEIFHTGRVGERDVVGIVTGMGTRHAGDAVERLLDAYDVDHVLVVGIAGAGMGDAPIGALVMPEVVVHGPSGREHRPTRLGDHEHAGHMWTNDELIDDLDELDGVARRTGCRRARHGDRRDRARLRARAACRGRSSAPSPTARAKAWSTPRCSS